MRTVQAAGAAIFRTGPQSGDVELLLVATYGRLNLPKGRLEEGENLYEGAQREVREETGITFEPLTVDGKPLIVETSYLSTDAPNPERVMKHVTIFIGEYLSGDVNENGLVVTDWENDFGQFMPVEDILHGNLALMKSQKDIIMKAIELYLEHSSVSE